MKRFLLVTGCCLMVLSLASPPAIAQDDPKAAPGKTDDSDDGLGDAPKDPPPSDDALKTTDNDTKPGPAADTSDITAAAKKAKKSWQDIVVLPRKIFLKSHRVELSPFLSTTINDNLIQHTALGAEFNYFLSDALAVGIMGLYYFPNVLNQEFLTRYHFSLVPTLNRYRYTATVNMSYVPIYGKFTLFNNWILQFEASLVIGAGVTGTEAIPRNAEHESFTHTALTFPVGVGGRLFVNRWLAVNVSLRYLFMIDRFEVPGRTQVSAEGAKGPGEFVPNLMVNLGVSFFFPLDFKYTTFR